MNKPWFKCYPDHISAQLSYPDIPLHAFLQESARKFPDRQAIVFYDGVEKKELSTTTYAELDQATDALATALLDLGIEQGDRVAYLMYNSPELIVVFYAILKAGAVPVPCNTRYLSDELCHHLIDSGSHFIFVDQDLYEIAESVKEEAHLKQIVVKGQIKNILSIDELLKTSPNNTRMPVIDIYNDLALLPYTGGTTGIPKGAQLTHRNMVVNAVQFGKWYDYVDGQEIFISTLPLSHLGGISGVMSLPISVGGTMILFPRFSPQGVLSAIQGYRATRFLGVPTMYISILNIEDREEFDLSSLKASRTNAAPLPVAVKSAFDQLVGHEVLIEGYGLTETGPLTHANPIHLAKGGSIGVPLPDTDARIVDLDDGYKDMPVGETGELILRGPQVMKGYWKKPDETLTAIRDGWFHTGDIARMDEDGYFYIVDRKKDMINFSGFKVWPRDVEEVLYRHEYVKMVAVIGVPDDYYGEKVKAVVVLKAVRQELLPEDIQKELLDHCRQNMASFKVPHVIELRDSLPLSTAGKILRRVLREPINK